MLYRPTSLLPDVIEDTLSDEELLSKKYYEVDELDMAWLEAVNQKRKFRGLYQRTVYIN